MRIGVPQGCEWGVFENLATHHPGLLSRVGQLAIELHAFNPTSGGRATVEPRPGASSNSGAAATFTAARLQTFASHVMGKHGFSILHRHLNLASLLKDHRFGPSVANALELERPVPEGWGRAHLWSYWELLFQNRRLA